MDRSEIVDILCDRGYYKKEAGEVVDDVFEVVREALCRGESVQIRGFGTFFVNERKSRRIKKVATGEFGYTKPYRAVVLKPSIPLRAGLNGEPMSENDFTGEDEDAE